MTNQQLGNEQDESAAPTIPHREPAGGAGGAVEKVVSNEGNPIKRFFKVLGPGVITGASDDDPSGIGTYAQVGASLGFASLWTALFSFPLMATMQYICAKIGMVSGRGLAGVLRRHYPRPLLYVAVCALLLANTVNAGADIGAIAAAIDLLVPIPIPALIIPIGLVILALQIWGSYRLIAGVFKWLALALVAYIASALFARPDLGAVLRGTFVPTFRLDATFLMTLVAILGTTISPYLFFWQASQEVEEEVSMGRARLWQRRGASDSELRYAALDVNIGMFFSNLVMYFIILATAATLFTAGQTDVATATDAAKALEPLAGRAASLLLATGLIGAGFLAVPILTGSSAYAVAEAFGWQHGLDRKPRRAKQFYAVIIAATVAGMLMDLLNIDPIKALFYTAVLNGLIAPPIMALVMLISNNRSIMGARANNRLINLLGWFATAVMALAALALVGVWLFG